MDRDMIKADSSKTQTTRLTQSSVHSGDASPEFLELHRLSLLGTIVTSVIHELNQPLTSMNMDASFLDMLAQNPDRLNAESVSPVAKGLLNDVLRMQKILDHLRLLAHHETMAEPTDINKVVENCFLLTNDRIRSNGIALSVKTLSDPVSVFINPFDLEYALLSLILNSCNLIEAKQEEEKSVSEPGTDQSPAVISIRISQDIEAVKITIIDNGHGIFREFCEQRGDPVLISFPSGKARPNGLFLAKQLIKKLGGELHTKRYDDQVPGEINFVEIKLPLAHE